MRDANAEFINVGDTVEVVDVYRGVVTRADSVITIANRYSLDTLMLDDIPEGVVRTREWKVLKKAVPDVLPVGTIVSYNKSNDMYVQTKRGYKSLRTGVTFDAFGSMGILAGDVRGGHSVVVYDPNED